MELESHPWIKLISSDKWDSNDGSFEKAKSRVVHDNDTIPLPKDRNICSTEIIRMTLNPPLSDLYHMMCNKVKISSVSTTSQCSMAPLRNKISRTFGIVLGTTECTIKATTQPALWNATHPIHHRYTTEVTQLCYPRLGGPHGKFHTDTFFSSVPSLSNCTIGQMHTNDLHFSKFYPMQTKSQAHETLKSFMQEIGIPSELHSNDAKELTEGKCKIF
jgi:hypothetical protein